MWHATFKKNMVDGHWMVFVRKDQYVTKGYRPEEGDVVLVSTKGGDATEVTLGYLLGERRTEGWLFSIKKPTYRRTDSDEEYIDQDVPFGMGY